MKWILFLLVFLCLISPCMAFEDTMQYHPSDDEQQGTEENMWYSYSYGTSHVIVIAPYVYPYNKILQMGIYQGGGVIRNYYPYSSSYWSFNVKSFSSDTAGTYIIFYDKDGVLISVPYDMSTIFTSHHDNDFYEFQLSSGAIHLYINGQFHSTITACTDTPSYIEIDFYDGGYSSGGIYFDDVSTDGYTLGIGTEKSPETWIQTAYNNEIDVEWTVKTIDAYGTWNDTEVYQIRTTWLDAGTVVNTTTLSKTKPTGFVVYNRSTLMPVPNYGTYRFDLLKDSVIMESDYLTFLPIGDSGTLSWDKSNYVPYQNASVTWAVTPFTPADYNYYIKTYNINTGLVDTNTLSANSGTLTESLDAWVAGSYYSLLMIVDKSDGTEYTVAFDAFDINDEVVVDGTTYDARTGHNLSSTNATFTQSTVWYNETSDSNGYYELEGFSSESEIGINASKTNYTHEYFAFTPPTAKLYEVDLYLFSTNISTAENVSMLEGMIIDYPLHQSIGNANVTIYNATWNDTTTSNSFGYYNFTDLWVNTTEKLNETFNSSNYGTWIGMLHTNMENNSELVSNATDEIPFIKDIDYEINYTTGSIKILESGNMSNWTDYHIDYNYYVDTTYYVKSNKTGYENSSIYEVTVIAKSPTVQNIILSKKYTLTVTATNSETLSTLLIFTTTIDGTIQTTSNGTAVLYLDWGLYTVTVASDGYYPDSTNILIGEDKAISFSLTPITTEYYDPSHYVKFNVLDQYYTPIPDVIVTTYIGDETESDNSGITGTDGSVSFEMDEDVRYRIEFINVALDIDKTVYLYPHDTEYNIIITETTETLFDGFSYSLDLNNDSIVFTYNSDAGVLTDVTMVVTNSTGVVHDETSTDANDILTFNILNQTDEYCVNITIDSTEYDDVSIVRCYTPGKRPVDLFDFSDNSKNIFSAFLLIVLALSFGAQHAQTGTIVIGLASLLLYSMNWLTLSPVILVVVLLMAIIYVVTKRGG